MAKAYSDGVIHSLQDWQEEQQARVLRLFTAGVEKLILGGMDPGMAVDAAGKAAELQIEADILQAFKAGGTGGAP